MIQSKKIPSFKEILKALGLVFGDIGTSPIYTLSVTFAIIPSTLENILGILSLIIWTLTSLVTIQYAWLAMSLSKKGAGEGGTIVLREILFPILKSKKAQTIVTILTFIGLSFFIGDGIITPAISILSAVEGFKLIPIFRDLSQLIVMIIAIAITITLFAFQKKGTEKVSLAFGPIMLFWFCLIGFTGLLALVKHPIILKSINPYYAINFILKNGFLSILLLSRIILCATGAEALYADMGHLSRRPIIYAWMIVFTCLLFVYLGQGAFLIDNPFSKDIFYEMMLYHFKFFYIPILILSIIATVIAAQAMISGLFSIVYQGITTNIMPRLRIEYTSQKHKSQIYIPAVNSFLLISVIFTILQFQNSYHLANAYGLAVSGSMTITAILLTIVFFIYKYYLKFAVASVLILINSFFLFSNLFKIPVGGYWSLIVASLPLFLIFIYTKGRKKLYEALKQMPIENFMEKYSILYRKVPHIKGTAVFLAKNIEYVPTYITRTMFTNNILYEENIIVLVDVQKSPFGEVTLFKSLAPGLSLFEIKVGYMEHINMEKILTHAIIHPKVIFYGVEEISTKNVFWKIFKTIKKLTPSFVEFYKLPPTKLHGVVVKVEM